MNLKFLTSWKALASVAVILACFVACGNDSGNSNDGKDEATTEETGKNTVTAVSTTEDSEPKEPNTVIKGEFNGEANSLIILRQVELQQLTILDSVRTDDKGRFELNVHVDRESIGLLNVETVKSMGIPVILTPDEKLKINISKEGEFYSTEVKGNSSNNLMKDLYNLYMGHNKQSAEFQKRVSAIDPSAASDSLKQAVNAEYLGMQKQLNDDLINFVTSKPGSAASYFAATYIVQEPPMDLLDGALTAMQKDIPESHFTKELESRLNSIKPLDLGGMAPNIALKNPDGQVVELESLRGKYVLIDFWASWCGPCRRENPNVVRMYQKYHDKGFEIYSVSLDNNAGKWKAAIQQDGLGWIHVSDLRGWQSSAAQLYQIHSIPSTVLLDDKGRIIAKDLRGASLEAKLKEIFN